MADISLYDLHGEVAIVTGAGRGFGRVFAIALAKAGADIVLVSRTVAELDITANEVRQIGRDALPVVADVTDEEQVQNVVDSVLNRCGKIDILVNNAGTGRTHLPIQDTRLDQWEFVMKTNVTSMFLCSRAVGREMIKRRKGRIVNVASMSGYIINRGVHGGAYDCSKAAVVALTKVLASEWAQYGINVNAIAPGYFNTEMNREFFQSNPSFYKDIQEWTPLRRVGEPEELTGVILFLASRASEFMTGATVLVDGGYTVW